MEILVVGAGCASCDKVYTDTQEAVKELGLPAQVRKVEDLVEMVRMGIMSVPAIVLDGRVISAGRTIGKNQIVSLLKQEVKK